MAFALSEEHQRELVTKSLKDESFAKKLKKDPKATIKEALGIKVPDSYTVNVLQNTPTLDHSVIPIKPVGTKGLDKGTRAKLSAADADAFGRAVALTARAQTDPAFRRELIANPRSVVEREFATKIPANRKIKILEETQDTAYLVLPAPKPKDLEISDAELEAVSGGTTGPCIATGTVASLMVSLAYTTSFKADPTAPKGPMGSGPRL